MSPTSCSVVWLRCPPGHRTVARATLSQQLRFLAFSGARPMVALLHILPAHTWCHLPRFSTQCSPTSPGLHALIPRLLHFWPGCLLHIVRPRLTVCSEAAFTEHVRSHLDGGPYASGPWEGPGLPCRVWLWMLPRCHLRPHSSPERGVLLPSPLGERGHTRRLSELPKVVWRAVGTQIQWADSQPSS